MSTRHGGCGERTGLSADVGSGVWGAVARCWLVGIVVVVVVVVAAAAVVVAVGWLEEHWW